MGGTHEGPSTGSNVVVIKGQTLFTCNAADANGISYNNLNPTLMGTWLSAIADDYLEYRFVSIRASAGPLRSGVNVAVAIIGPGLNTSPTSVVQVAEMERAWINLANITTRDWHYWPKSHLLSGLIKWYRFQPGTPDDNFEYQGALVIGGLGNATTVTFLLEYVCEFRERMPAAVTTARIEAKVRKAIDEEEKKSGFVLPEIVEDHTIKAQQNPTIRSKSVGPPARRN